MSELLKLQWAFARLIPRLYDKAFELGFEIAQGDAFRDPRVHGALGVKLGYGHKSSAHKNKLAHDLNLFKDGVFQGSTEAHRALGEWWEGQHPKARWGGRFADGNHYSFEYNGVR
jgi:hypothetical protein